MYVCMVLPPLHPPRTVGRVTELCPRCTAQLHSLEQKTVRMEAVYGQRQPQDTVFLTGDRLCMSRHATGIEEL